MKRKAQLLTGRTGVATYWELLKDPRWQRKRLEVMEAAEFECEDCGAADRTLNVHHTYYAKGKKPWEYANDHLACLCEDCHRNTEFQLDEMRRLIGSLWPDGRERALGFLRILATMADNPQRISVESLYVALSVGHFFDCDYKEIQAAVDIDGFVDLEPFWQRVTERSAAKRLEAKRQAETTGVDR